VNSCLDLIPNSTVQNVLTIKSSHVIQQHFLLTPERPTAFSVFEGTIYTLLQAMASKKTRIENPEPTTVPLSTVFRADDADVVIRAAGSLDFRAHKCILSLTSLVFKNMFTVPQPPTDIPGTLPHVDVTESAGTWEIILRTIYPMPTPLITSLSDLEYLLLAAKKYEMQFVIDSHKRSFQNHGFILRDPLYLYAIACACGFEDQAKYVARKAELQTIMKRSGAGDLKGLTVDSYHNLVSFLTRRDTNWHQALGDLRFTQEPSCCAMQIDLYSKIKANLEIPYLLTGQVYIKALEDCSRCYRRQTHRVTHSCSAVDSEIKAFIKRMAKERENICNSLMHKRQYVRLHLTALHPKLPSSSPLSRFIQGAKITA